MTVSEPANGVMRKAAPAAARAQAPRSRAGMTPANGGLMLDRAAKPRRTGLELPPELPFETWQRIGGQIALIADSSNWWLGDWLAYGTSYYADRYRRAVEETRLDYQTLRNYAWIARRFPMARRRDKLSMQHHAEVARLPVEQQELWLDRAERHRWSRNRLRAELRRLGELGRVNEDRSSVRVGIDIPPDKEAAWSRAAGRANSSLAEWIILVLDDAAASALDIAGSAHGGDASQQEAAHPA